MYRTSIENELFSMGVWGVKSRKFPRLFKINGKTNKTQ